MPRVRLGVVVLVPEPVATEIDGMRRALGDPALERIAPHLTLVPPVNVAEDALGDALAVLRDAAACARPFTIELGPVRSFAPDSATLYLAAGGDPSAVRRLGDLREAALRPPLLRTLDRPFVPHVTIANDIAEDRAAAGVDVLADYRAAFDASTVHLLVQRQLDEGRRWVPLADARLGPRVVVGRGGVELELTTSTLVDPEGQALLDSTVDTQPLPAPAGARPVVVTARRSGAVVGIARGWIGCGSAELATVVVREGERGQGIGRQLPLAAEARLS